MMWNWLVSSLAAGSTIVLYDGSPCLPTPGYLFDLTDDLKISLFGTSPKYLQACQDNKLCPRKLRNKTFLRSKIFFHDVN